MNYRMTVGANRPKIFYRIYLIALPDLRQLLQVVNVDEVLSDVAVNVRKRKAACRACVAMVG